MCTNYKALHYVISFHVPVTSSSFDSNMSIVTLFSKTPQSIFVLSYFIVEGCPKRGLWALIYIYSRTRLKRHLFKRHRTYSVRYSVITNIILLGKKKKNFFITTRNIQSLSWLVCICVYIYICVCVCVCVYTGCPRRNVPDFGRVFLMLQYTDITQNTYVQSLTVTEIMAREVWNFDSCYTLIDYQIHIKTGRNMWFL